jgi:hypothetical protein
MPRKDKKKKSKGKKGFSTADILKLLKKLKPQTQQVVRVNVGDSDKKKKKGDVQSSYNPPFVFPQQGYPAITSLGQPPFRQPLIEQPTQVITRTAQPEVTPAQLMPPPPLRREISGEAAPRNKPTTPRITDVSESEFSDVEVIPRMPRKSQGYSVRQPYKSKNIELVEEPSKFTFQAPKIILPSNLSATSSQPTRFNLPVQNDKFQADIIRTDPSGDQIGTLSNKVPSSEWTGSPQGEPEITPEERQAVNKLILQEQEQKEEEEEPLSLSDVFLEEPSFEELQQQQLQKQQQIVQQQQEQLRQQEGFEIEPVKQKKSTVPVQGVPAPEKEMKVETGIKTLSSRATIDEINKAVRENGFVISGIPAEFISSRNPTKGQIKQDSKNKIMSDDIKPVYQEMLKFTGQAQKKAPFIIKKTEE